MKIRSSPLFENMVTQEDFLSLNKEDQHNLILKLLRRSDSRCIELVQNSKVLGNVTRALVRDHFNEKRGWYKLKGPDLLISLRRAIKLKNWRKANSFLNSYYNFYGLDAPKIISDCGLSVGSKMKIDKKIFGEELVTIIITAYNAKDYITNSIESIINQTWKNIELIVVDDGSSDGTSALIESTNFSNFKHIKLDDNVGTFAAKNLALSYASGKYVTFQDADDWAHPKKIEMQVKELIKDPFLIATLSKFFRVNTENGLPYSNYIYPLHRLNPSSLMMRLEDIMTVGTFNDIERTGSDSEIIDLIRKLFGSNAIKILQEPLSVGSYRKDSLTGNEQLLELSGLKENNRNLNKIKFEKKNLKLRAKLPNRLSRIFENKDLKICFIGFSPWKIFMNKIFHEFQTLFIPKKYFFLRYKFMYEKLIFKSDGCLFFSWGYKTPDYILKKFNALGKKIYFVEDGFIRSKGLGSSKEPPLSITIDSSAPHFDANKESDLEILLRSYDFQGDMNLLTRSRSAIKKIISHGISKYNCHNRSNLAPLDRSNGKKNILVVGQVETDDSIKYGSRNNFDNEKLLELAIQENPYCNIYFKPHIENKNNFRSYKCEGSYNQLANDYPVLDFYDNLDRIYTITSLLGFEFLLRGLEVTVVGCPFYSGWGLTDDRYSNSRRKRNLSIEELFAGAYIKYPLYLNPYTYKNSTIEEVLEYLISNK